MNEKNKGINNTNEIKDKDKDISSNNMKSRKVKNSKIKFRHRHPILFYIFWSFTIISILTISAAAIFLEKTLSNAPRITEQMLKSDGSSNMYDINGTVIWSSNDIKRDYVKYDDMGKLYRDLLISVEDKTYKTDIGFSKKGLFTRLIAPFVSNGRGGSSIEEQLIKMTAFDTSKETTLWSKLSRKIQEPWLATQLDANFSKEQILEFYVNKMYLGENSYGAETIAKTYFGLSLKDMDSKTPDNLSKLAIIAGLGQAPSAYNLYTNPELVAKRRNNVLYAAMKNGIISEALYKETIKVDVTKDLKERYWRNNETLAQTSKYNAYITSSLNQLTNMGYDLKKSKLQIYTYLNPDQQNWLTDTVNAQSYQDDLQQVAVTVMDVNSGVVIAQSGGRNEEANGLNRAIQMTRSSGSSMKPFVGYGPAIEYFGYGSNSVWDSSPYTYPGTNFVATNYGGYSYGYVTMQYALAMSLNTPVNRILDGVTGSAYTKQFLSGLNLDVKDSYGGSDALGLNVSTEQEAAAYAALANNGTYKAPQYISKIVFSDGSEKTINVEETKAMKESTAYILNKMLETTTNANMSAAKGAIPEFAGLITKTGTTNYDESLGMPDYTAPDSWISGSTKSIAVSIWTGYDSPNEYGHGINVNEVMKYNLYQQVMRHYNEGRDTSDWSMPNTVVAVGNNLYKPTDTGAATLTPPVAINAIDTSSIISTFDKTKKIGEVSQENKDSGVPKDYVIGSWTSNFDDNTKSIYDYYINKKGNLPTIKDFITDKTYNNN